MTREIRYCNVPLIVELDWDGSDFSEDVYAAFIFAPGSKTNLVDLFNASQLLAIDNIVRDELRKEGEV